MATSSIVFYGKTVPSTGAFSPLTIYQTFQRQFTLLCLWSTPIRRVVPANIGFACISTTMKEANILSLEMQPDDVFKRYMNKHCDIWTYNDRQLQSIISRFADIIVFGFAL